MSTTASSRRHDLDALRAGAMLLGIVLHVALAFDPAIPWPIRDVGQSDFYSLLFHAIHGFRMPLFFCLSGFFTAMLWRKRGLKSLLGHRFKRIFLPLVIGGLTIAPLTNWLTEWATARQGATAGTAQDIWMAAATGNIEAIESEINKGQDPDELHKLFRSTPLTMAVVSKKPLATQKLLELGADPDAFGGDGSAPLHAAAMFGRWQCAQELVAGGADITLKNKEQQTAAEVLETDIRIAVAIAAALQISMDVDELVDGREKIAGMLDAEVPENVQVTANEATAGATAINWMMWLAIGPVLGHLWFLWFLCWLVAAFIAYSWIATKVGLDRVWRPLVCSPLRYLYLIPITMVFELTMPSTFGPDTSIGLLPLPHILTYYAVFFFFGAVYYDVLMRSPEEPQSHIGKRWWLTLPLALLVLPIGIDLKTDAYGWFAQMDGTVKYFACALCESLYAWLAIFGLIGLFRQTFSTENRTLRYVSDSSYWLYLAHMPLVVVVQAYTVSWAIPSVIKFTAICSVISAVLLVTYEYGVRYTPIGTLLNGPRQRPARSSGSAVAG